VQQPDSVPTPGGPLFEDVGQIDITDPGSIADRLTDSITDLGSAVLGQLPLIVLATVVFVLGLFAVGLAHRGVVRATAGRRVDPAVAKLIQTLTRAMLVLVVGLLALSVAGVNVGSALAALGIAGLAIAFAVQSILENFIAGILILIRRPFRPGDQVRLGDFEGTVTDINLRVTTIVDYDGEKVLLPNSTVFSEPIINTTERGRRRSRVTVGVEYRDDHDDAREVLRRAVESVEGVLPMPPPQVLLLELNSSSVDFEVLYWTTPEQAEVITVRDRVLGASKRAIADAGMTIPWPIRTLVLDPSSRDALRGGRSDADAGQEHRE
jgi:small-conductance mechanosensitive channel